MPLPEDPFDDEPPRPGRPRVVHNGRQLDDVVTHAAEALGAANDPPRLFVRAGQMARVRSDEDDRPIIEGLRADHVRLELSRAATWWRANKDGELTATSPPLEVASSLLAAGEWELPPLTGVVELPVLRPDGTFHLDHGYDPSTRLYHWHRGRPYRPVPDSPSAAELAEAVAVVDETLCDFPWDTTADRANAWAMLVTPFVRPLVGQVPMALVDAPEPGTGKGLLVAVASIIASGRPGALMAWPGSDEELEKKVFSVLLAGATMVIFDNVEGMIKSPTLAAVLTADAWQGRILGRSENATVPNRATWVATGNNIDVGGDLARRCYQVRLDAHQARPWQRSGFRHPDLVGWVTRHRSTLLHAICTIVRSWWVAGRPQADAIAAMGGYTPWVRNVGGILAHAGVEDFLANLDAFHAHSDVEARAWEAYLTAWADHLPGASVTVAELIDKMKDLYTGAALREVLPEDLAGYWDTPGFSRRLSLALRRRVGRHYGEDGLHLVAMPRDRRQVAIYAVAERSEGPVENPSKRGSSTNSRAVDEQVFGGEGAGVGANSRAQNPPTRTDGGERGSRGSSNTPSELKNWSAKTEPTVGRSTPATPAPPVDNSDDDEVF